jgi:hypothetical protein
MGYAGRQTRTWGFVVIASAMMSAHPAAVAQVPGSEFPADSEMTLVTGTRFVTVPTVDTTAKARFMTSRIALSTFNETDHCIDQRALEAATTYFDTFGRELAKAGHYYFVPNSEIAVHAVACEAQHGRPPQAWVPGKTDIIAFGRVVPSAMAAEVEQGIR